MDENKLAKSSRGTRSRRESVESPTVSSPRKNMRQSHKMKDIVEMDSANNDESHSKVDDNDDAASSVSSNSLKSCKVVLQRENLNNIETLVGRRAIAHGTRSRRGSQLTEENVAALSEPQAPARRALRSKSVASDSTELTQTSRRSTRLTNSQNTPKAEAVTQPTTPARRSSRSSSRLLTENEKATDSPVRPSTPARRNLRSNSVASEDVSPPRRTNSRLSDSQAGTPKALKTKVSKIKEPTTPRRSSMRINKSVIASDIIDEEPSDEEILESTLNKTKQPLEIHAAEDELKIVTIEEEPEDIKPILTDDQKAAANKIATSSSDLVQSPRIDHTPKTVNEVTVPSSPVVLLSTSTLVSPLQKAQTPSVEPTEPMETSMTEQSKLVGTPKGKPKDTQAGTPKGTTITQELAELNAKTPQAKIASMVKLWEKISSPSSTEGKGSPKSNNATIKDASGSNLVVTPESNEPKLNESNSSVNRSRLEPRITSDFEPMDMEADGETVQTILKEYSKNAIDNVERSVSTPNPKPRASTTLPQLDVSVDVVAHNDDNVSTPQMSKKSSKQRQSMNDTVQSTGFDQMEVSILSEESKIEKVKLATPKQKKSPMIQDTPSKITPVKANTPKSIAKTPQPQNLSTVPNDSSQNETTTEGDNSTPIELLLLRPPRESTFGGMSSTLSEAIDQIVADLDMSQNSIKIDELSVTTMADKNIDEDFDAIAAVASKNTDVENVKQAQDPSHEIEKNDADDNKDNSTAIEEHDVSVVSETQFELDSTMPAIESCVEPTEKKAKIETANESVGEQTIEQVTEANVSLNSEKKVAEQTIEQIAAPTEPAAEQATEPAPQSVTVCSTKRERKSVQILTPKMNSNQMAQKRIDTPFPDESSILEASQQLDNSEENLKRQKRIEERERARDALKKLQDSWSKSIKRNCFADEKSNPIDALGVADTSAKTEEEPLKKVVAPNNWGISNGLVDSDSEDEEVVPESEEGSDEEDNGEANEFVDDEVEVIEGYESGDSMDEDERREIDENKIEEQGVDIGSEDTDSDDESDDYEDDGFIVDEDSMSPDNEEEIDEEEIKLKTKRRMVLIESSSSSDESDSEIEIINDVSNDIESVSLQQVESVVVIAGNPPDEEEEIMEGEKFATTYLTSETETQITKKIESPKPKSQLNVNDTEKQEEKETTAVEVKLPAKTTVIDQENHDEAKNKTVCDTITPVLPDSDEDEKSEQEQVEQITPVDGKENEFIPKKIQFKHRTSLSGIDRLPKESKRNQSKRASLSDLNPNAEQPTVAKLTMQPNKAQIIEKSCEQAQNVSIQPIGTVDGKANVNLNESASSNVSLSPNNITNAPLNISSQEENNNRKSSKKDDAVEQMQSGEQSIRRAMKNVVTEDHETVTSTSQNETIDITKRSKRKFVEFNVDVDECEQPKAKKLLKIVHSSSGKFIEEPMTPEKKNKFGFREAPRTPINPNFRIQKRIHVAQPGASKKRKSIYLNEEDDDIDMFLPRPNWQINTQFECEPPKKRARKLNLGSTEFILQPVESKKKSKRTVLLPVELVRYRHNKMYRPDIPRQSARSLLRERQKRIA